MTNTKITAESFLDNKELREQTMARVEVLDKVKQLFLIPELECLTVKQVADYFEVDVETIQKQYQRNKDEFDSDGTSTKPLTSFNSLGWTRCPTQNRGSTTFKIDENTIITINNCGIKCFPKRAVLRMGMLLRDSRVAKEVRNQLLNTFEHATMEQRTYEITEEKRLLCDVVEGIVNEKSADAVTSLTEYVKYKNRYIAKIEQHNAELTQVNAKISEEKQKVEKINKDLKTENHVLATDILQWTDRASANRLVRVLAGCMHRGFADTFNLVYHELLYKYSISLKNRAANAKKKNLPLIAFIRDDEWIYLYKVVAAMCNTNGINLNKLFKKAKIDVSDLDLTNKRVSA